MIYTVRHLTRYHYAEPVRESVMEVRKHPQNSAVQRCVNFHISVVPEVRLFRYQDYLGNQIFHFNVPWAHDELLVTAEAVMEVRPNAERPQLDVKGNWDRLEQVLEEQDHYDMLLPSRFVEPTATVLDLAGSLDVRRRGTPYELALELALAIHSQFSYDRSITKVDSPVDLAIENRRGVCQDFAHILLSLLRPLRLPCRYVSGYLFRHPDWPSSQNQNQNQNQTMGQSQSQSQGQGQMQLTQGPEERTTHAWVEALIPRESGGAEWVGFDPTLGVLADDRHIVTCVGRDYADVPPTRGVYRGNAASELSYAVQVHLPEEPIEEDFFRTIT